MTDDERETEAVTAQEDAAKAFEQLLLIRLCEASERQLLRFQVRACAAYALARERHEAAQRTQQP